MVGDCSAERRSKIDAEYAGKKGFYVDCEAEQKTTMYTNEWTAASKYDDFPGISSNIKNPTILLEQTISN